MFFELIKIAWKNIWRYPRRSILTAFLVCFACICLILVEGLSKGISQQMINQTTRSFAGAFSIYHQSFKDEWDAQYTIDSPEQIEAIIETIPEVVAYTPRMIQLSMLSTSYDSTSIELFGIDFEKELGFSKLASALVDFESIKEAKKPYIIVGKKLAEKIDLRQNEAVIVSTVNTQNNQIVQELFYLAGSFQFDINSLDTRAAFIDINKMQSMLGLTGKVHEYVLRFDSVDSATGPSAIKLKKLIAQLEPSLTANTWKEEFPTISEMLEMSSVSFWIMSLILFILINFTILNTIFMSIHERSFEFGVIRAIGTRKSSLFLSVLFETAGIVGLGCVLGSFLGLLVNHYVSIYGIDYGNMEMMDLSFKEPIRSIFYWQDGVWIPSILWLLSVSFASIPAWSASKINIIEALHKQF